MSRINMLGQERILAIDIGGGTQDILLYDPTTTVENCYKLVVPSPTVVMAGQVRAITAQGKPLYLGGTLMGGGPVVRAIREHLDRGLPVYANADAAKTISDDLSKVQQMGIGIVEQKPADALQVNLGDMQLAQLQQAMAQFGVDLPVKVAVAAQDHGEAIGSSNRKLRFDLWQEFLKKGGALSDLLYTQAPAHFTRLGAIQRVVPGAVVMDTGSAAVWGALCDEEVARHREQGMVVVNLGNQHTLAFYLKGERIWGVFEHHTRMLTGAEIGSYIQRFIRREVTNEEVFDSSGHGCWIHPEAPIFDDKVFVAVTGPNRALVEEFRWHPAAPFGDMMLAGCFGLIAAEAQRHKL